MCESTAMTIGCYTMQNNYPYWSESNVYWNMLMTGNSIATLQDSKTISYANGVNNNHTYEFDITKAVFDWRAGNTVSMDRGILFKAIDESKVIHKTFGSYNRAAYNPVFKMQYLGYEEGVLSEQGFASLIAEAQAQYGSDGVTKFNCLAMSLADIKWIGYSELGINSPSDKRYLTTVGSKIVNYVNNGNCRAAKKAELMGVGLSPSYMLTANNQYFIAVRVMQSTANEYAFHVIAQTNTGTWMGKHGSYAIQKLGYINPDITKQSCWQDPKTGKYYDSATLYIRITR